MVMKLKLMALTIACAGMIIALPTGASANWRQNNQDGSAAYWRQNGQDWYNFISDKNIVHDNYFKSYNFNSNDGKIRGNMVIINMNDTTGSAVTISFDNSTTTSSAVNLSFDDETTTGSAVTVLFDNATTTSSAVNVSLDKVSDIDQIMNEYKKQEEEINAWIKDFDDKMNKDFDRIEKEEERFWKYFNR
jgi:hypothetical protein